MSTSTAILLLLAGIGFAGTQFFGMLSVLPDDSVKTDLAYLVTPMVSGFAVCLLSLRLINLGRSAMLHLAVKSVVLSLLIMVLCYLNVYFAFGSVNDRLEPAILSGIGLFSMLFSMVRLLTMISRRTGTTFQRLPLHTLVFAAAAAAIVSPVLTLAAAPVPPELTTAGLGAHLTPYILMFAFAAGLFAFADRYREDDETKQYKELQEKELRYMSLFAQNPDGVIAFDANGNISDLNDGARKMLDLLIGQDAPADTFEYSRSGDRERLFEHYDRALHGAAEEIEVSLETIDGEPLHLILTSLPIILDGRFSGAYSIAKNVTDSKKNQEKIRHLAYHDELTGLTNRKHAREYVDLLMEEANPSSFHLLFIDFDRFKKINDLFGHDFGDKVITRCARKLHESLPSGSLLSRSAGDEFIAVLPEDSDAGYIAQRICDEFMMPFRVGQQMIALSASIGIARFPEDGLDSETLFQNADQARYDAQSRGGGRFAYFDRSRAMENHERLILERDLQSAIENDELVLFYQPKVDIRTHRMVGLEALVRWNHPTLGMVPPLKFIPIAEESGLIVPLERWVLRTACLQTQEWIAEGRPPIPVAVNLSQIHLMQTDIVENILATLEELKYDTRLLELEVTESAMMHNEEQVISILRKFKKVGISVSLDDFGTGYSSLSYLHMLPIDCLKIDRSFIKGITTHENSRTIVEMILTMARQLGLSIIAEGIEYEDQAQLLRELRCFTAQGFHYSKPVPAEEVYACSYSDSSIVS
ncbi:EAL domain-containing protein [Saccharibacillus sp. CPCC 101409]|uniref:putative bifunctional diguanylate cyclase/phosphodiesterase n=1 Tax=Saccharibacillus sp. CPCC 101409 TaxID=3058041 RepID=UPI002673FA28|nr:EAL domain-containing protein [Saccharibacillus sp. CPCC 101409]MDO3412716.1 EAL domain-containing protein [Saccharibacillus sp. CPCC 101409]